MCEGERESEERESGERRAGSYRGSGNATSAQRMMGMGNIR